MRSRRPGHRRLRPFPRPPARSARGVRRHRAKYKGLAKGASRPPFFFFAAIWPATGRDAGRYTGMQASQGENMGWKPMPRMKSLDQKREQKLIRQAAAGDREAAGDLIKLHQTSVYAYILRMSGRPEVAEDIVQEAFVRVLTNLD